jgi:hypothetical protein
MRKQFLIALLGIANFAHAEIDFNREIRPLLSNRCFACHGPDEAERKGKLRLDTREGALKALSVADPSQSEVLHRIALAAGDEDVMPPKGKGSPLTPAEQALLRRWIDEGSPYATHWAYTKPVRPKLPETTSVWPRTPIDHFVLDRLRQEGLAPSPEADRYSIARRVALDLTGLPPSWEAAVAFANDKVDGAYERFVDAQIAKSAFGERWARVWLDLARYADSTGYASDAPRTIWAYRDYVIRSLNANKPFDQFTIEQLAGDLLEKPGNEQLVATAFHRNTLTNTEGGTVDEEWRNAAVVDRVNTTMAVWMGTTMACAQCHTHKYDPITQEEYFRMFAILNQTEDADRNNEAPTMPIRTAGQRDKEASLIEQIAAAKKALDHPSGALAKEQAAWLEAVRQEPEWRALAVNQASAKHMALSVVNGAVNAAGNSAANDDYTVALLGPAEPTELTALRLEVAAEQASNFVLSRASARWMPDGNEKGTVGRFVRVSLKGDGRMIHLAELQIFSSGENIACKGKATQSSTDFGGPAARAIDGNTNGDYAKNSVTHTAVSKDPWFQVELAADTAIEEIVIWNRTGASLEARLAGYDIAVLDANREVLWTQKPADVPAPSTAFTLDGGRNIGFAVAVASYEQNGFPAASVLAPKIDVNKGWAIGGGVGRAQQLMLVRESPVTVQGGRIVLTLQQQSVHKNHLLTHFAFSYTTAPGVLEWARMPADVQKLVKQADLSDDERAKIAEFFRSVAPSLDAPRKEIAALEKQLAAVKPDTTVPVMRELGAGKQRKTHVQIRGNYKSLGQEVTPGVPAAFNSLETGAEPDRLALAKWLMHADNPLTARVIANRHWEQIFGLGIVESSDEFGSQGGQPSHPELLDWLAVDLRKNGWDLKRFIKQLVMSAAYRQSSKTTPEQLERDPTNRLLARGPRFRVSAEMVRDQALAVSGLLSDKMYGPPVRPVQPQMGLRAAFGSGTDWKTSAGSDRHRRGLYTLWRRSSPYPSMATFDAPNREICTLRRSRTNTPLQALVTLNDPVYIEAAQALSRRIAEFAGDTQGRAAFAIRESLLRPARAAEIASLARLYKEARADFATRPDDAKKLATEPLGALPVGGDPADFAAWTVVANVVLNLDEMLMKR